MKKAGTIIQRGIIYTLIVMMSAVLILATVELGYYLINSIVGSRHFLMDLDQLMDLFGVFMLVLIGIELLDTIKVYLKENVVHVEVIVLVAIIAVARKVVVLKIEEIEGLTIMGIGIIIVALAVAYYFIKKAGLMICSMDEDEVKKAIKKQNTKTPGS
jgi:uncharacterized membrane protein (DUF373 family)